LLIKRQKKSKTGNAMMFKTKLCRPEVLEFFREKNGEIKRRAKLITFGIQTGPVQLGLSGRIAFV